MGFHESATFPEEIALGSRVGPGWRTSIVRTDSGAEQRVQHWADTLHQFDARYGLRNQQDIYELKEFYLARAGAANGFRFKDFSDYTSNSTDGITSPVNTDQNIGTGDGSAVNFSLRKQYTNGGVTYNRAITKPRSGVTVALDGVNQTSGFSVNLTNGVVTFTTAPALDVEVTAGFEFDVPSRFGESADELLAITLSAFEAGDIPSIPIEEIRDPEAIADAFYYGGSSVFASMTANATITMLDGSAISVEPTTTGLDLILPDLSDVPAGGPIKFVTNIGSQDIELRSSSTDGSVLVTTLSASTTTSLIVSKNSSGSKTWYAT